MKKSVFMICLAVLLHACSIVEKTPDATTPLPLTAANSSLVQAYAQTIVAASNPATGVQGKCVNCHTARGSQSIFPFADSNSQVAFDNGITTLGLVNVGLPSASIVLQYLTNGHCGSAECQASSSSPIYATFLAAAQAYAKAATQAGAGPSGSPSPTPSPGPTLVPVASLGGMPVTAVALPNNPPLLGEAPLVLEIPLLSANPNVGTSSIELSVAYTVVGTASGKTVYLYDIYAPVLVNRTGTETIKLAGFYVAVNGTVDLANNLFSDLRTYKATTAPGMSSQLYSPGALDSLAISASPGDQLTLVIESLVVTP